MWFTIDFESEEAYYSQLCNQVILGIAMEQYKEGDTLPSVRQMAEMIGINMHTVNKAYSILKQEGYLKVDNRRGAVVSLDVDKLRAMQELQKSLSVLLAKCHCKNITRDEVHALIDEIYDNYGGED
ncbi:MAG: GntR family transcriptional regulator [Lachnospiraceae bacterium]|nr:GntR family transcriptional regulator [Lachnospiraceae bacterium]